MAPWPVHHTKGRFGELLDAPVRGGAQVVSRRRAETAVLFPIEECRRPEVVLALP